MCLSALSSLTIIETNPNWRTGLCIFVLLASAFASNGAQAVSMTAVATFTGAQGDSCFGGGTAASTNNPSFFPQSATWSCTNSEGKGSSKANAFYGSVGAFATAISLAGVNKGSESGEGTTSHASYSDSSGMFLPKITGVDPGGSFVNVNLNVNFNATASGNGGGGVVADAYINGRLAAECVAGPPVSSSCQSFPVQVALNQIVTTSLIIDALADANANGQLVDFFVTADGADTFSFAIGGPVFSGLPDGVTFNDPDAFIFNNIYSPPGSDTPIPAALPLFATGLGGLGLLGWRRKRKQAA